MLRAVALAALAAFAILCVGAPASAVGPVCENIANGPDAVMYLCVEPGAPCPVYIITVGHEGETTTRCVLP